MNNIFLQPDPLLNQYRQQYTQVLPPPPIIQNEHDWVLELDNTLKELTPEVSQDLQTNEEWNNLNNRLSTTIHEELMNIIKSRLSSNPEVISNVKKQLDIINKIKKQKEQDEKDSMKELNDYMKNYSHLTFDEYKKLKNEQHED